MAIYPRSDTDRRVSADALQATVTAIFKACSMDEADASLLAETLVHADLRGVHSHGTLRVPEYVKKLVADGVDPRGRPFVVQDRGAALVIDGANSMGQIAGTFAMAAAIERARNTGLAFAAVRGSNHCGAMDWYTLMAVRADMVGIAGTNALPTMAPWGGADKIVGINPLSVAFPAAREKPFVLDFAFGATAHGKIRVYHQKGSPIPEGWAFDEQGRPTTSAADALRGLIQPIGGHKGVGLGMAVGMLSTLLSGAAYGLESGNMVEGAKVGTDGHFFMALDIAAFADVAAVRARVDGIIEQVHGARCAPGTKNLLVPGELEAGFEQACRSEGIPLSAATLDGIFAAATSVGAEVSVSAMLPTG